MNFRQLLDQNISLAVQRAIVGIVLEEYRHTHAEVSKKYGDEEAFDVQPHIRRANIESALLELEDRFKGTVLIRPGITERGHHYRFVVCGDFVLTQSYVESNRRVPRDAMFRNGFAGDPNQMLLDPEAEAERTRTLAAQELTYVIITHTPSVENAAEPSHVSLILVDKNCRCVASINLIEKLRGQLAHQVRTEEILDQSQVKLRKDAGGKREMEA